MASNSAAVVLPSNGSLPVVPMRTNGFVHVAISPVTGNLFVIYNDVNGSDKGDKGITGEAVKLNGTTCG